MKKTKIVLVEDDEILGKVISEELEEAGFDITHTKDGEAGIKAIKAKMAVVIACPLRGSITRRPL